MFKSTRFQATLMLAAGALLGFLATTGNLRMNQWANAAEHDKKVAQPPTEVDFGSDR